MDYYCEHCGKKKAKSDLSLCLYFDQLPVSDAHTMTYFCSDECRLQRLYDYMNFVVERAVEDAQKTYVNLDPEKYNKEKLLRDCGTIALKKYCLLAKHYNREAGIPDEEYIKDKIDEYMKNILDNAENFKPREEI